MLVEVVDSVASEIESGDGNNGFGDDDDDDEEEGRMKRIIKEKISYGCNVLCIWDCANIWIKISEVFAFIVFDAFTEVFITLCILVNVIFMALDHYTITYDPIGCQQHGEGCGM